MSGTARLVFAAGIGVFVLVLGATVAMTMTQRGKTAAWMAETRRAAELRQADERIALPARARLYARAGLARVLAELRRQLGAGVEPAPEYGGVLGQTFFDGIDRYAATVTRTEAPETYAIEVEGEVREGSTVRGRVRLRAQARVTPGGWELVQEQLEDLTPSR